MFDRLFSTLHLKDLGLQALLDILILAFIVYQLILLIRGTRSVHVIVALMVLVALYFATAPDIGGLKAVNRVLGTLLSYVPIAAIVLFQNQIRRFLSKLGQNPVSALLPRRREESLIEEVSLTAASLAAKRHGALIVIERDLGLRTFYETGIVLDALVSYDLLMNIFTPGSALHDGAVVLADSRVKAASCYLPLTMNPTLSRMYGTRHRAAFGITEESDAVAVVVSEERGVISFVEGGRIVEHLDTKGLEGELRRALCGGKPERRGPASPQRVVTAGSSDAA